MAPRKVDAPSAPVCGGDRPNWPQQNQCGAHHDQVVAIDELAARDQQCGIALARRQPTFIETAQRPGRF
jgi:hypothetical protein